MTGGGARITTAQALAAAVVLIVLAAGVVNGLSRLLAAGEQEPPLSAPAIPAPAACPDPERPAAATPERVTAGTLIECPRSYDGRLVRYEGEAVRAVLRRGERAWVHLNDDPYALTLGPLPEHRTAVGGNSGMPVSIPADVAAGIAYVGDHRALGDRLEVTGRFHRADPLDAGGPAIQAETARISQRGRPTSPADDQARVAAAAVLTVAAGGAAFLARLRRVWP